MDQRIIEMGLIWGLILLVVVLMLSEDRFSKKQQTKIIYCLAIGISVAASIRTIGWDIPNYQVLYRDYFYPFWDYFKDISSFLDQSYEPLNYILALIFGPNGFQLYLFVTCIFPFFVVCYLSKKQNKPLLFFGTFFLLNLGMIDQSRQFLSSGFTLLSYVATSYAFTFFWLLFATMSHFGVLPSLIIGFFKKRRPSQCNLLFLGIVIFCIGSLVSSDNLSSLIGTAAGRMDGYFSGFFSANNFLRIIMYFYVPVTTIILFLSHREILQIANHDSDQYRLMQQNQAANSAMVACVVFVALLASTGSDVIATRIYNACAIGNFLVFGKYLETYRNSKKFVLILLWLISVDIVLSSQYFYGYVS